ncbi:MAG: polyphosphate kinase 1 [Verrucomicrobiales bacterium]
MSAQPPSKEDLFLNREISWLQFNRRVLEEAQDEHQPLLERIKFLTIVGSNLDEFFEIRVSGIKQQIEQGAEIEELAQTEPRQVFAQIRRHVLRLVADQYKLWNDELRPALQAEGIDVVDFDECNAKQQRWLSEFFAQEVFPILTPLAIDPSHPFPQLLNKSHNLIVTLSKPRTPGVTFEAIVQIPRVIPRLVVLPPEISGGRHVFVYLKALITEHLSDLFPGLKVESAYGFRITRNSDLYLDEEEIENLLRFIEEELKKRSRGNAVRLEIEQDCPPTVESMLLKTFELSKDDLYRLNSPLTFLHLQPLLEIEGFNHLKDRPFTPVYPPALQSERGLFALIREKDRLLHHPFDSFNVVVDFIEQAASDRNVLSIKMTLYRTSGDSPILRALIQAARAGKQVTALMEIKARFDEANNINWARKLEEAGVHVVYGLVGLKTHSKLLLIVRRDEDRIRLYAHVGTGNYHPSTARFYTDLGLLTDDDVLTYEAAAIFNKLTGLSEYQDFKKLLVAPYQMAERFLELIERERKNAEKGLEGRIVIKVNSLVDPKMIRALYAASQAGVRVELIVRGICCLRPGLPGVSDNIRVISVVGRFLEHSRIYYFHNDGDPQTYIGSADWMPRNLYRRVEVVAPVEDPDLRRKIIEEILPAYLTDCMKARELKADGTYRRLKPRQGQHPSQAQLYFRQRSREEANLPDAEP